MKVEADAAGYTASEAAYLAHVGQFWAQRWPADVPREARYPLGEIAITEYLREWARRTPAKPAIVFYGREISYGELDRLSDRFAALLGRYGFKRGDRVAVFLPNCPQFFVAFYGILKAGGVHVPVNPMFREAEFIYELNDTAAEILVTHDQLLPVVEASRAETSVRHVLATSFLDMLPDEPFGPLPSALTVPRGPLPAGVVDLMAALVAETGEAPQIEADLDAVAALNYTGGTTGMPKGCVHTQRNMLYTAATGTSITADIGPDAIIINFWPIFWMAGEDFGILIPVISGGTCVLLARWDPEAYMAAVERYKVTFSAMVVDNAVELMEHPRIGDHDLTSLQDVVVASFVKKLNVSFREGWRTHTGATLREAAWGMTETHSVDTFTRGFQEGDADLKARQVFCGLPVPGTVFKIMEFGSDRLKPLGEEGELCVRSPSLLKGYWNKPDATREGLVGGWLRTGDIGMIGEDGSIHFLGRRKEMLKVKGMSVFPAEIEAVLGQHPAVTGSGVIGREDPVRGQVPVAFVTLHPAQAGKVSADDLTAFCRERLAVYKIPELRIAESLPMTTTGKVKKEELAQQL
ncbi:AMP-binding protein [Chelatococcus reniformis]|nr:AMP-binding protein [Chelatococcus reniformis]